jgi:hypothetical protein
MKLWTFAYRFKRFLNQDKACGANSDPEEPTAEKCAKADLVAVKNHKALAD